MKNDRTERMRAIRDEVLALSTQLAAERRATSMHPVIGEGSHLARVMFVGEAPGRNEAATGRPFVGAAGKILDELLTSAGIPRPDVYITNIVKDRPPMNRDPEPREIEAYGPFLDRQVDIIRPEIIATLGRFAMGYILTKFGCADQVRPISLMHGTVIQGKASYGPVRIIPLYHPAVAVYNASMKDTLRKDFAVLRQFECSPLRDSE
jgi:DNA polymerase